MSGPVARAGVEQAVPERLGDRDGRAGLPLPLALTVLAALLAVSAVAGLAIGSVHVPPGQVWGIVTHALGAGWVEPDWSRARETIVLDVRAPRVLLGAVAGAGLAVVGTALQALIRNPLAEPYLLGVSSGASLGAVTVIVFGVTLFGPASLSAAAFAGALGALLLVYATARTGGRITSGRLVLSGVAVASVLTAVLDLLLLTTDRGNEARAVLAWTLGGLGGVTWDTLWLPGATLLLGVAVLMVQSRNLNLLLAGEEAATTMGLDVARFRARMFVLLSLVTGVLVAACGPIGFVGLMLPHIVRLVVGGDHRRVLPGGGPRRSGLPRLGRRRRPRRRRAHGDTRGRAHRPVCGGPFFLWLMRRDARRSAGRGGS